MNSFLTWFPTGAGAWCIGITEIAVLAVAFYFVIGLFRGTRGEEVMWGFVLTVGALFLLTKVCHLEELQWMLQSLTAYVVTGAIVVFHPEIRRALAEVGKKHVQADVEVSEDTLAEIEDAIDRLSKEKIGALIAIERENTLHTLQESGRVLDAEVTADLLCTIFYPGTALHDGGVVISKNRLVRAGCMFPMATGRGDVEKNVEGTRRASIGRLGMRHRAALGLSEDTDAVVIVVSEETGAIRVATNRKLTDVLELDGLTKILNAFFVRKTAERHTWFRRWRTASAAERASVTEDAVIEDAGVAVEVPAPAPAKEESPAASAAPAAEAADDADDSDSREVPPPPSAAASSGSAEVFPGGPS